jgi:hypothetical protein
MSRKMMTVHLPQDGDDWRIEMWEDDVLTLTFETDTPEKTFEAFMEILQQ